MKLLLDTHAMLWHADGSPQLSATASSLLSDPANQLFLSIASIWEVAIKSGLKKLSLSSPFPSFMARVIAGYGLTVVPITFADCIAYESLHVGSHRDPFDRMIVIHALRNGLNVISADASLDAYAVVRLW